MTRTIRIGTRASKLATAQTGLVAQQLENSGQPVEIVPVSTPGDRSSAPISEIGVGVFTSALREALTSGEVDVAVHSYKDLPTAPVPGITLAAVPERADPRDVLIATGNRSLGELPPGSRLGTGSPRRAAQLRALGLGHELMAIRGNLDTRLGKLGDEVDAVLLAKAGLQRTGRTELVTETIDPLQLVPAPAQGALAVETRTDDVDTEHLLHSLVDDESTRLAATAERAVLSELEAGCTAPVGALADVVEDLDENGSIIERLSLRAVAAAGMDPDPGGVPEILRVSGVADKTEADSLGRQLATELLELGAGALSGP